MEYKILETGNRSKHNNQNNYQRNIKYYKQGTDQNITNKTTTIGISNIRKRDLFPVSNI
jgi:hypothetical protein